MIDLTVGLNLYAQIILKGSVLAFTEQLDEAQEANGALDVLRFNLVDQKHLIDVGIFVRLARVLFYHGLVKSKQPFFILLTLVFLNILTFLDVVLLLERLIHRRTQLLAKASETASFLLLGSFSCVICLS